ncbi:MAG: VWA domain-containing protein [Verrucomicrobiota bacterium]
MNFAVPAFLWLLAGLLPLLAAFLAWTWRRKQAAMAQFVRSRLLARLTVGVSPARQVARRVLVFAAVGTLLLALARPRWGFTEEETRASGLDLVVCLDVSRSMLAADLKPSRLARAKLAVYDLMALARSDRLGLVAFAGTAFLQCPLALDPEAFRQSVLALDTEIIPEPGTALGEALDEARQAFQADSRAARAILLLTDGEDHEEGAVEAARRCYQEGIRVFTVGLGSPEGELLRGADPYGNPVFVRDERNNVVKSRLNEAILKQMAEAGGGFYLPLQNAQTMGVLHQRGLAPLPKGEFAGSRMRQWTERFQWPLGLAVLLLLAEMLLPEQRRVPRSREIDSAQHAGLRAVLGTAPTPPA